MQHIIRNVLFIAFVAAVPLSAPILAAEESPVLSLMSTIAEIKNSKSESERLKALQKLHGTKPASEQDVQALLGALREKVIDFKTADILWNRDNPQLIPFVSLFIQALDDPDLDVQGAAALTLGKMKAREAVPNLIKRLESIPRIDEKSPAKDRREAEKYGRLGMFIAMALGQIGDPRAVPALLERREFYYVEFGGTPIAWIGAPALPELLKIAKNQKDPRKEHVCFIISNIKDPAAIPSLRKVLKDPDAAPDLKNSAITALKRMNVSSENFD